ncbi:hypothetical protein PG984_006217 [Apiospora sp. TS-2023a]
MAKGGQGDTLARSFSSAFPRSDNNVGTPLTHLDASESYLIIKHGDEDEAPKSVLRSCNAQGQAGSRTLVTPG